MGPFHQEVYVATVQHMVEAIVGRSLTDAQYRFAFPVPEYVQAYKTIFHSPCVFDTTVTEVVLPVYWLKERSPFANSELAERGWRLCARMIRANSERLVNPTAASVEALLTASGKTIPHLDDIARELNCSARSLNRRLATEGVSFRELRKKILCTRAARLLTETTQSVAGIANSLGYQDEAAFYRLFKRQMGVSPGVFRSTQVGLLAQDL
jgi:AraC-like DNA-binding protein